MQENYWNFMTQCRFSIFYLNAHFSSYVKRERLINIFLALTSSSVIAAWAIWQSYNFVWAFIIALAQVLTVVNNYLPYKKRISEISDLKAKLGAICNDIEYRWYEVSNETLTDEDINKLRYEFNKKWTEVDEKAFTDDALPYNENYHKTASDKNEIYFKNMF